MLQVASLDEAQRTARELHLLRAAVERQLAQRHLTRAPEQRPAEQKPSHRGGGVGAAAAAVAAGTDRGRGGGARSGLGRLVGTMASDAAKGRTLLDSDALAAAEVAV